MRCRAAAGRRGGRMGNLAEKRCWLTGKRWSHTSQVFPSLCVYVLCSSPVTISFLHRLDFPKQALGKQMASLASDFISSPRNAPDPSAQLPLRVSEDHCGCEALRGCLSVSVCITATARRVKDYREALYSRRKLRVNIHQDWCKKNWSPA